MPGHTAACMPLTFRCFGATIAIDSDSSELLADLRTDLPLGSVVVDDEPADVRYEAIATASGLRLTLGGERICDDADLAGLAGALAFAVGLYAPDHVFIHAGAVAWRNRVIVVPGRSRSGKTSMVHSLARAGALYLSDEYAVVDEHGLIHPYPRALGVRGPNGTSRRVPIASLGGTVATEAMPVALVLATTYRPDAHWEPTRETRANGLLALLDNTLIARHDPERCLAFLRRAIAEAVVLKGVRGDADTIVPMILAFVEEFGASGDRSTS
jgi:hypothetical protein